MRDRADALHVFAALDQIDRGEHTALVSTLHTFPFDVPFGRLVRAELFVYLDRLDEAEAELEAAGGLAGTAANRRDLLIAEIALWRDAHEEALAVALGVVERATCDEDARAHARARAIAVRCAIRRGDYRGALLELGPVKRACEDLDLDHQVGILDHCAAYARFKLREYREAGAAFARALAGFDRRGDLRWSAACRNMYAVYLSDLGRPEDALGELERARASALEIGAEREALWADNNRANLLIIMGREAEAAELLSRVGAAERGRRHGIAETYSLLTLVLAKVLTGDRAAAEEAARAASTLAELCGLADWKALAAYWTTWCEARRGVPGAVGRLRESCSRVAAHGQPFALAAEALLADALIETRPDEAAEMWECAMRAGEEQTAEPLCRLVGYVRARLSASPIRVGAGGELIFDVRRRGFPSLDEAMDTLERYLLGEAVKASFGNRSEAAKRLDVTRSRLHDRYRILVLGRPAREAGARGGDVLEMDEHPRERETNDLGQAEHRRRGRRAAARAGHPAASVRSRRDEGGDADGERRGE